MSIEIEIEQRAGFTQKLHTAVGLPSKTFDEYLEQARNEVNEQNNRLHEFFESCKIGSKDS